MPKSKIKTYAFGAIACALALFAIINWDNIANASQTAARTLGPYMLMQHSNPTAAAGVFRVNVNTGYVSYCYIDQGNKPTVTCTGEATN